MYYAQDSRLIVDSSSLYSLIALFSRPDSIDEWSRKSAYQVTLAATQVPNFRIAPGPGTADAASGAYDVLTRELRLFALPISSESSTYTRQLALNSSIHWADENASRIGDLYQRKLNEPAVFDNWLNSCLSVGWVEHAQRLGGLFNPIYIPQLARILRCTETELKKLHGDTLDPEYVRDFAKRGNVKNDELLIGAYVVASLIRGYYHYSFCGHGGFQSMHHAFRDSCFDTLVSSGGEKEVFVATNTEIGWCDLLLNSACQGSSDEKKIKIYGDNLRRTKQNAGLLNFNQMNSQKDLETVLYDNARKIGLVSYSKWVGPACSFAFGIGSGGMTNALGFSPFVSGAVSAAVAAASAVADRYEVPGKLGGVIFRPRLKGLSQESAGRVYMLRHALDWSTMSSNKIAVKGGSDAAALPDKSEISGG